MKTLQLLNAKCLMAFFVLLLNLNWSFAQNIEKVVQINAHVVDAKTNAPLAYANIMLQGSNVATVTNVDGEFSLKVEEESLGNKITVSFIGYRSATVVLRTLLGDKAKVALTPSTVQLPELSVISKDAKQLIDAVFEKKAQNYGRNETQMTAFYRESVRKGKTYVSLAEGVVDIFKQAYNNGREDVAQFYKLRKQTDYSRLDTLTFKLMGGPFNNIYLDVMKYPDFIFTANIHATYDFEFDRSTYIDDKLIYVIDFKPNKYQVEPLYAGKLYIDAEHLALRSAVFDLMLDKPELAASMFVRKKPINARTFATQASYRIDYNYNNGRWYYAYSRIELGIRINWRRKLFNTNYNSVIEMAVTDHQAASSGNSNIALRDRIRPTVVVVDKADGFADPEFWGEFNVIEPDKPIETAIRKIQRQLERKSE